MYRDIEQRYFDIKVQLRQLFDQQLTGRVRDGNASQSFILSGEMLYAVNAGTYVYDMDGPQMASLLEKMQAILDDILLEDDGQDIWAVKYVGDEYRRGMLSAYTNLSRQSVTYSQQPTLSQ